MDQLIIKKGNSLIIATGDNKAEINKILQEAIKVLNKNPRTNIQSLYSQTDLLIKLRGVLTLHEQKGNKEIQTIDLKELQIAADNCNEVDCNNCALDNVADSYGLFNAVNKPLLKEVIKKIESLPHGKFRSVKLSTDILIGVIKSIQVEYLKKK